MSYKVVVFFAITALFGVSARVVQNTAKDRATFNYEPNLNQYSAVAAVSNDKNYQIGNEIDENGDYDAYPKYNFKYGVEDQHSGDKKLHYEERDGDVVKGQYKVLEPDGYIRIVDYTVDKDSGYNAVVTRTKYEGSLYNPAQSSS